MKANRRSRRAARQLFRLCLEGGVVVEAERVRQIARRIGASRRRGAVAVLCEFGRLVRLDRDRHTALVESAVTLPAHLRDAVQADLARRYGPALEISFAEDRALIAGMRIKVASDVYDGSIRARLAALAARV